MGPNSIGRPLGRKDRVKEYLCEKGATRRGGFELATSVWIGRGGGFSAVAITLENVSRGSEVSEL